MSWEWHRHRADHASRAGKSPPRINVHRGPWPGARASSRRCWRSVTRMRRAGVHGDLGYSFGGFTRQLDYGGALAIRKSETHNHGRITRPPSEHRWFDSGTRRYGTPAGRRSVKWNLAANLLLNASVLRPLGNAGLNPQWVGAVALEYLPTR